MSGSLKEIQLKALSVALNAGELVRRDGGYWTYPSCPSVTPRLSALHGELSAPTWHVGIGTVIALVRRGYLTFTDYDQDGRREIRAVPTQLARKLI